MTTLQKSNAKEFTSIVKGENFMTPTVLGYYKKGKYAIELSSGKFLSGRLYGVTVADTETKEHVNELCKSFETLKQAKEYMEAIQ